MKRSLRIIVIALACLSLVACQAAPKAKPLTELSEAEQRAAYVNGPARPPEKKNPFWKKALGATAVVIIAVPIVILTGLARSGTQK